MNVRHDQMADRKQERKKGGKGKEEKEEEAAKQGPQVQEAGGGASQCRNATEVGARGSRQEREPMASPLVMTKASPSVEISASFCVGLKSVLV